MDIRFEVTPGGDRRALTVGLRDMGQSEFALVLTNRVSEEAARRILTYIGTYVKTSHQRINVGETMRYGWSTLRFSLSSDGECLIIEELEMPYAARCSTYVIGASRALNILIEQDRTVHRNKIKEIGHHPHRSEMAIICRKVNPYSKVMVFDRLVTNRQDDSGWFIGCGDSSHNHDDVNELGRINLVHIVEANNRIVRYLAMPVDTRVVFDDDQAIVFPPAQEEGHPDDEYWA
jgi:hypothetical protein